MTAFDFEILLRGVVEPQELADLGQFEVRLAPATTVLVGEVADQRALVTLLVQLRSLGLTVIDVRRTPDLAAEYFPDPG